MIDPFMVKHLPVVNQSVRPHLYQDVHGITSTSRLNLTASNFTTLKEVNHLAKEVKQLDDKEEEVRVAPGGTCLRCILWASCSLR